VTQQDYLYLIDSIKFKALRFAKGNFRFGLDQMDQESLKINTAVGYAREWREICINKLDIPAIEMNSNELHSNISELAYAAFLQNQTSIDDWFSLYVVWIPCVYVGPPRSIWGVVFYFF
jgi:thiaminase